MLRFIERANTNWIYYNVRFWVTTLHDWVQSLNFCNKNIKIRIAYICTKFPLVLHCLVSILFLFCFYFDIDCYFWNYVTTISRLFISFVDLLLEYLDRHIHKTANWFESWLKSKTILCFCIFFVGAFVFILPEKITQQINGNSNIITEHRETTI